MTRQTFVGLALLDAGTHLMHLETGRHALYAAVGQALKGTTP